MLQFSDADMQSAAVKAAAKERRARELEEEVETKARQVAVLQSKEVSVRRKGLLKVKRARKVCYACNSPLATIAD